MTCRVIGSTSARIAGAVAGLDMVMVFIVHAPQAMPAGWIADVAVVERLGDVAGRDEGVGVVLDEDRRSLDPVAREELAPVVARRLQRAAVVEGGGPDEHQRAVRARAVGRRDLRDLDPVHRRRADGAEGDDLDLLLGIAVAVVDLVLGVEALDDHRLVLLRHRTVGHRRAQLEALAVIPAFGDELDQLVGAGDPVRVELLGHAPCTASRGRR